MRYLHGTGGVAWTLTAIFCIIVLLGGIAVICCSGFEDTVQDMTASLKRPTSFDTAPTVMAPTPKIPSPRIAGASPQPPQMGQPQTLQVPAQEAGRPSLGGRPAPPPRSPSASSRLTGTTTVSARLKHPPARLFVPTLRGQSTGLFDLRDSVGGRAGGPFLQVSLITTLIKPPEEYVQLLDLEGKELGICGYYPKGSVGGHPTDFFQLHLVGTDSDEQEFQGHLIKDGDAVQLIKDERLLLTMKNDPQRHVEICGKRNNVVAQVAPPGEGDPGYVVAFAHGSDCLQILLFLLGSDRFLHYADRA